MAYSKSPSINSDDIELQRLNNQRNDNCGIAEGTTARNNGNGGVGNKKSDRTVNFSSEIDINGNKMKTNKKVQFGSDQNVSNEEEFEIKPNLIPNRKRCVDFPSLSFIRSLPTYFRNLQ